jgi:hypothetical protein
MWLFQLDDSDRSAPFRSKIGLHVTALAVLFAVYLTGLSQVDSKSSGRLHGIAAQAKRFGKSEINVPHDSFQHYAKVPSLEIALRTTTPLLIRVEYKISSLSEDGAEVLTWNRARVIENLSSLPLAQPVAPTFVPAAPANFGEMNPDTIAIETNGGKAAVDGVVINTSESPVALTMNREYVVFVRLERNPDGSVTHVARFPFGLETIFEYHAENGLFSAIGPDRQDLFIRDLFKHWRCPCQPTKAIEIHSLALAEAYQDAEKPSRAPTHSQERLGHTQVQQDPVAQAFLPVWACLTSATSLRGICRECAVGLDIVRLDRLPATPKSGIRDLPSGAKHPAAGRRGRS